MPITKKFEKNKNETESSFFPGPPSLPLLPRLVNKFRGRAQQHPGGKFSSWCCQNERNAIANQIIAESGGWKNRGWELIGAFISPFNVFPGRTKTRLAPRPTHLSLPLSLSRTYFHFFFFFFFVYQWSRPVLRFIVEPSPIEVFWNTAFRLGRVYKESRVNGFYGWDRVGWSISGVGGGRIWMDVL